MYLVINGVKINGTPLLANCAACAKTVSSDRVIKAWRNTKGLATQAKNFLTDISPGSPSYQLALQMTPECAATKKGTAQFNNCMRIYIANNHPAYTQFFGANPEQLQNSRLATSAGSMFQIAHRDPVLQNFQKTLDNIEDIQAASRNGRDLYLTAAPKMINDWDKEDICAKNAWGTLISWGKPSYAGTDLSISQPRASPRVRSRFLTKLAVSSLQVTLWCSIFANPSLPWIAWKPNSKLYGRQLI